MSTGLEFNNLQLAVATGILVAGVVDDLRSRKFHNWLFLTCAAIAFVTSLLIFGFSGLLPSLLGFLSGFFIMLPLVLLKIVGGGDLKLMAAFGAITSWNTVLSVAILALVWGALFGVVRVIASGQAGAFARNMRQIVMLRSGQGLELHRMPYTVALLFGWLSHISWGGLNALT